MKRHINLSSLFLAFALLCGMMCAGCGNDESYWGTPNPGNAKVYYAFEQELARAVNANATTVEMKAFDANGAAVTAALVEAEIEKMDTDEKGRYLAGAFVSYKAKELVYAFRNGEEVLDLAVVPVTVTNNMVIESKDNQFVDVEALAYDAEGTEADQFAVDDTITIKVFANDEEITDEVVLAAETENVEQIVGAEVTNEFMALADGEATFAFEYKGIAFTGMAPVTIGEGPIGAFAWLLPDNYNLVDGKIMDGETEISADDIVADISMEPKESRTFTFIALDETASDESYVHIDEMLEVTVDTETPDSFSASCSDVGVITLDVAEDAADGDTASMTAAYEGYELQNEVTVTVAAEPPVGAFAWLLPDNYNLVNGKIMDGETEISADDIVADISMEPNESRTFTFIALDETASDESYVHIDEKLDVTLDTETSDSFSASCSDAGVITLEVAADAAEGDKAALTAAYEGYELQNEVAVTVGAAPEPVTAWVIPGWYTIENGKLMDGDQEVSPEDVAAELSGETQRVNPGNTLELRVVAVDEETEESVTYKFAEESFDIELNPDNGNFSAECSADGLVTIKADDSAEFNVETTFTVSNDNYDIQNTVTAKVVDFEC